MPRISLARTPQVLTAHPAPAVSRSQPPAFFVPRQRFPNAVAKPDLWRVPDLCTGATDVKGATFSEEIHSTSIYRRFDPERHADRLAGGAREPERPHGQF